MNTNSRTFLTAAVILLAICLILATGLFYIYKYSSLNIYNWLMLILISCIALAALLIAILTITAIAALSREGSGNLLKMFNPKLSSWVVKVLLMPILNFVAKFFRLNREKLDEFYVDFNNAIVKATNRKFNNSELILLLPHCLQNKSCNLKVTNSITNCRRCGKCDIGALYQLSQKWGINAIVVTGGTAARAELSKLKPAAAISVACERDLASGIKDVGSLPVFGVLNMRPNGPCCNTRVSIEEVEAAIRRLAKEDVKSKDVQVG